MLIWAPGLKDIIDSGRNCVSVLLLVALARGKEFLVFRIFEILLHSEGHFYVLDLDRLIGCIFEWLYLYIWVDALKS